jgi:hypothetical protein
MYYVYKTAWPNGIPGPQYVESFKDEESAIAIAKKIYGFIKFNNTIYVDYRYTKRNKK